MNKINIITSSDFHFFKSGRFTSYFQGSAFLEGQVFDHTEADFSDMASVVKKLNGFFAWILTDGDSVFVAVDRVRSRPIFYINNLDTIFISNDPQKLTIKMERLVFGDKEAAEFQLSGFVLRNRTLVKGLSQVPAGVIVEFMPCASSISVVEHQYYNFSHTFHEKICQDKLYSDLDNSVSTAVSNLIKYAGGRQIVVPLSGGYDSRLIATYLSKHKYENVLTFTYGVTGNKEARYSKKVAENLKMKWVFVEYTPQLWERFWNTGKRREFQRYASAFCSLPHIQDLLALDIMHDKGIVDADCVFAPGHSADFVAGSHIPSFVFKSDHFLKTELLSSVFDKHFSLAPISDVSFSLESFLEDLNSDFSSLLNDETVTSIDFADAFELWDWRERQSKFIVNSVRVYEFFGYDWWLPLWDNEFVEFWETVPLSLREGRCWYIDYVKKTYSLAGSAESGEALGNGGTSAGRFLKHLKAKLKQSVPRIHNALWYVFKRYNNNKSPLSLTGRIPEDVNRTLLARGYKINGVDAKVFLDALRCESSKKYD